MLFQLYHCLCYVLNSGIFRLEAFYFFQSSKWDDFFFHRATPEGSTVNFSGVWVRLTQQIEKQSKCLQRHTQKHKKKLIIYV